MIVRPHRLENGTIVGFSIDHYYISRSKIRKLLLGCSNVSWVKIHRWRLTGNVRGSFCFRDIEFVIYEPFGESTEYIFESKENKDRIDVSELFNIFVEFKPSKLAMIFGEIADLSILSRLFKRTKKQ